MGHIPIIAKYQNAESLCGFRTVFGAFRGLRPKVFAVKYCEILNFFEIVEMVPDREIVSAEVEFVVAYKLWSHPIDRIDPIDLLP